MFHYEPTIVKEIAIIAISNFQKPKLQLLKVDDETESQQYRIYIVILPW